MLLSILFVGAVLFTNGVTAQTTALTATALPVVNDTTHTTTTTTTTTTTQTTAPTTTALPLVIDTTHTTTTTNTTESTTPTMIQTTTPNATTTSTIYPLSSSTTSENTPSTVSYAVNPVRIGLRAVLKSTLQLNITLANQLLQQYIAYLPSYYNVTARVTSITTL